MNNGNNKTVMMVITLVAGLLIGGGLGYAAGNKKSDTDTSMVKDTSKSMEMSSSSDGTLVGGSKMVRTKDIVDNAVNAKNVSTVVAAVKAAGLVDTLKSEGPFTVFAPNNDAFAKLPAGTVDTLLKPENKAQLAGILTYHVVPGTYTAAALKVMATKGESLTTVQGEKLSFAIVNNAVVVQDAKGNQVSIETPDIISSNGVTHVITAVLMP